MDVTTTPRQDTQPGSISIHILQFMEPFYAAFQVLRRVFEILRLLERSRTFQAANGHSKLEKTSHRTLGDIPLDQGLNSQYEVRFKFQYNIGKSTVQPEYTSSNI